MKRIGTLLISVAAAVLFFGCSNDLTEDEIKGSIAGSVSDQNTGEPVATVNVSLSPGGSSTVTGTDGTFNFLNLKEGEYTISISKNGYKPSSETVTVTAGEPTSKHLLIERIPAVVTADRELLDFGSNASTNTMSFNIVNASYEDLAWEIENRCEWITEVKPSNGTLKYGKTEAIVVVIDRELLASGPNEAVIVVRSSNGSYDVKVKAVGAERYVPQLNTLAASDITSSSATLNGEIIDAGSPTYTERGFVYSLNSMPTFDNMIARLTSPVTEDAAYYYALKGLTLGETYYVRAYAINSIGTAYSTNEINFMTVASSPELTIQDVTDMNVSKASATFNGTVVSAGDPALTEKGFVYGIVSNPTVDDTKVKTTGVGVGEYTANIIGLEMDQTYYVRTYAINKVGEEEQITYSGTQVSFTLTPTKPAVSIQAATSVDVVNGAATLNATISNAGEPPYTERGFVYGLYPSPTLADNHVVVDGTGIGLYYHNINNLLLDKTYYVRAYATNVAGTAYSEETTVSTNAVLPQVITSSVVDADIATGTATFVGSIVSVGQPAYTERGFVYSTVSNPTIYDATKLVVNGEGVSGSFSVKATDLPTTEYYVRAYATNRGGTVYGEEQHIALDWVELPAVGLMVQKEDIGFAWWSSINAMCENSTLGGYTDWRLPDKDELMTLYTNRDYIGGFSSYSPDGGYYTRYWSSSLDISSHYYVNFFGGGISSGTSQDRASGRCVRTLK